MRIASSARPLAILAAAVLSLGPVALPRPVGAAAAPAPAAASAATPSTSGPLIKPWGLYLDYIDRSVKPGDDFYMYANGKWLETATIAPDRSFAGSWLESIERADERLRTIVAELHTRSDLTPEEVKLRDLYDAYVDTVQIEKRGLAPIQPALARIAAARTPQDLAELMTDPALRLGGPFRMRIAADDKHPNAYAVRISQSGLGLPDRDYYLKDEKELAATREAYRKHLAEVLGSTGVPEAEAAKRADAVFALERSMAVVDWPAADRRDADKTYNPMTIPELERLAPGYPWAAAFQAASISLQAGGKPRTAIASEKSAFPGLAKIFAEAPLAVWRDYLAIRCVHSFADYLPRRVRSVDFAFYGTTLAGQAEEQPRETRGVRLLDRRMGEALGKLYVAKYFPPEAKVKIRAMVDNLIAAFEQDLARLAWMTPATREKAHEKLKQFIVKVGYPDQWRDYAKLSIERDDLVGSIENSNSFDWHHDADRIDSPVDRMEWGMSAPTVNAYYEPTTNEICFPAGILQPPHFDLDADDAVNYGGIGATIGHEISHAFDDEGSKYDGTGMLYNWWSEQDRKQFAARTDSLVAQYDAYEPLPGLHINGRLTLGENIGDLSGVEIARKAYLISLGGKAAPALDGWTGDQRFYLSYAQNWRMKSRDAAVRRRTISNEHADSKFRVIGVTRNIDSWYEAFPDVKAGERYYLPPEQRVRLW
jgi:putative endopeptidase